MTTTPPPAPGPLAPSRLVRLARKELTEVLRDRRTITTLVVMPLLLYPLLTIGFGRYAIGERTGDVTPPYRLGFASQKDHDFLSVVFLRGAEALRLRGGTAGAPPTLWGDVFADVEAKVREGVIDVGCRRSPIRGEWELVYREDSPHARDVASYLQKVTAALDAEVARGMLEEHQLHPAPLPRLLTAPLRLRRTVRTLEWPPLGSSGGRLRWRVTSTLPPSWPIVPSRTRAQPITR